MPTAKAPTEKFIEAVGRRKTASARVRITPSSKASFLINDKELAVYFPTIELQTIAREALDQAGLDQKFTVTVLVKGGGIHSQAEAMRLGLARAATKLEATLRGKLKKLGFLKRDPRMKERRKYGLKKARKAPQWSKR